MLNSSIRLGKVAGVEIGINISLILIAGLLAASMADSYFKPLLPNASEWIHLFLGAVTALFFFASILLHELAHALMAQFFDVPVKRIVLFIFGGMAEIEEEPRKPHQEFWIALIGPISSAVLGGVFLGSGAIMNTDTAIGSMMVWLG
ncbi:MAG TPA: site-2 protease family protein, partial [Aggregatilineales bacterium]|nr:site-2 protease family protein [Aggregatilineales bacterium]